MPTLEELNAILADPGFQQRHEEFKREMYERLEPLGDAIQKLMKPPPAPPTSRDPDLMTEEELLAAFEAMPLSARQEAMKRALDEEMGPVVPFSSPCNNLSPKDFVAGMLSTQFQPEEVVLGFDKDQTGKRSLKIGPAFKGTVEVPPWPPLSREQVVQLHKALRLFIFGMNTLGEGGPKQVEIEAWRLFHKLDDLGLGEISSFATPYPTTPPPWEGIFNPSDIKVDPTLPPGTMAITSPLGVTTLVNVGSPPPKRTWTHEEVARAAEEVQSRAGLPRYMTEGVPNPTATELAILESMGGKAPAKPLSREEEHPYLLVQGEPPDEVLTRFSFVPSKARLATASEAQALSGKWRQILAGRKGTWLVWDSPAHPDLIGTKP